MTQPGWVEHAEIGPGGVEQAGRWLPADLPGAPDEQF